MQKIILDTIKQFRETYYGSTCGGDGLFNSELFRDLEDFLKQALTKAFEAGQKSREKEIVEKLKSFIDPDPVFLEEHREKIFLKEVIKSLSLTKESKEN